MPAIRSIAILLHERHASALAQPYRIWALCANWRRRGIRVEPVWGTSRAVAADLLIPHLDLSQVPEDYAAFLDRHPNVVNRGVRDIRKATFSSLLVRRDDGWDGPVIVKTDNNARGWHDEWLLEAPARQPLLGRLFDRLARRLLPERRRLGRARGLTEYHIFPAVRDVPRAVWGNRALVVERFLPERSGAEFVLRSYTFFGDRGQVSVFKGREPVVKIANSAMERGGSPPEAIVEARRRLGLDYAKLDYVVHDGRPHLLDVNPTPFMGGPIDAGRIERSAHLADGLASFERA